MSLVWWSIYLSLVCHIGPTLQFLRILTVSGIIWISHGNCPEILLIPWEINCLVIRFERGWYINCKVLFIINKINFRVISNSDLLVSSILCMCVWILWMRQITFLWTVLCAKYVYAYFAGKKCESLGLIQYCLLHSLNSRRLTSFIDFSFRSSYLSLVWNGIKAQTKTICSAVFFKPVEHGFYYLIA